jgi:YfiH family protein
LNRDQPEREEVLSYQVHNGVGYWQPKGIPQPAGVVCAFSSRQGGISEGPFGPLNLGLHVGDEPGCVLENRQRFSRALGVDPRHWVAAQQVHGCNVAVVSQKHRGLGAYSQKTALCGTDGLVTAEAGVWLSCYYADCVPLVFWDSLRGAIGIAHAGWRGTLANIGVCVVRQMVSSFGCEAQDLQVLIGPAIGACCYVVGEEVAMAFEKRLGQGSLSHRHGRSYLDLRAANRELIVEAGIPPDQIHVSNLCTACHPEAFFSHRRDGSPTGRMTAIIGLREQ